MLVTLTAAIAMLLVYSVRSFRPWKGGIARVASLRPLGGSVKLSALPQAYVEVLDGKARLFKEGNPIVYNGAIKSVHGDPEAGDEVSVKDNKGNVFGRGYFNPRSQYRVRMIATHEDKSFDAATNEIISDKVKRAADLRHTLSLPREGTDVYRLINGEGDGLSGLMVDVLGDMVVIQSSAVWVEKNRNAIEGAVRTTPSLAGKQVLWKQATERLKQDGWEFIREDTVNGPMETQTSIDAATVTTVVENGVRYSLCAEKDQKTGFYCDQRENRQLLRSLVKGKTVLDLYCYTGGFTLNAVLGGATSVTCVDSSLRAVQTVRENIRINGFKCDVCTDGMGPNATTTSHDTTHYVSDGSHSDVGQDCSVSLVKGDAQNVMRTLVAEGKHFDVVVCDPPKLAPTRTALEAASRKYQHINALAMQLVSPEGGLLLSCSCSAAMTQSGQFEQVLNAAARSVGRTATVVSVRGAAGDHTVHPSYPEGRYLTAVLLYVK
jgi:23S rRNA G2069 N7-methylase RlmK/C1962 C5-methylase RlmI